MLTELTELVVCRDCDTVHRRVPLQRLEVARCTSCGAVLERYYRLTSQQLLALTLAAAMLFAIASATPLLVIEVGGMRTQANVWTSAVSMGHGWMTSAAVVLALTTFLVPMAQIALLAWLVSFACGGRRAPGLRRALVLLHHLRPWSMTEVFLLGALVAIVKLSSWVHVLPGVGIWALGALTILLTILSLVAPRVWWTLPEEAA